MKNVSLLQCVRASCLCVCSSRAWSDWVRSCVSLDHRRTHIYTHNLWSYHICQCLFLHVNLFAWVWVCVEMPVCVSVCKDLPQDNSHAPLISTATCWLSSGSGKINPTSLKDPRKGSVFPALITTLITIVVWMWLHFSIHCAAHVFVDARLCARRAITYFFSAGDSPLSAWKQWGKKTKKQLALLSLRIPSDWKMQS